MWWNNQQAMFNIITTSLTNHNAVTAGNANNQQGPIWGSHAYEVENAFISNGTEYITVYILRF